MADGRFDDLLMAMAKKHSNVEELTFSLLSFFERRTDLFHVMETNQDRMGFAPGAADKMLFKHFDFCQKRYMAQHQPHLLGEPDAEAACAADAAAATEGQGSSAASSGSSAASAAVPPQSQPATTAATAPATSAVSPVPQQADEAPALPEETRRKMKHISTWNGAVTDKYYWSQSLSEVTVETAVDADSKAADVQVDITATRLSVKSRGRTVLEGKFHEKVAIEDSMWSLEDGCKVILTLQKHRETWWKCVLEGDPEIDTTKVESTRSMEEYDGETQGAIRKIMFDQNQKLQGKATSDQIRTADVMKDAWNAPGSPFRGTEFDPSMLNLSGPVGEEFFADLQKKKIEAARERLEASGGAASSSAES
eukprot:TRINITY_DN5495_c0_g1_i1.p1 TRINITY_DN5495_c0_g1~~TRINITY_DN5495_c0_g1_i1.p1  ORF type:complete len:366 (-),score=88.52 TRINITY_DN5495_c0_g1_i1:56-1153(-)